MRKRNLIALGGVIAVLGAGGTWAYFNQGLTAENVFDTGKYDTVLVEDFKPEDGETWEPGAKVNKDVNVVNTGDYPVVVRVKFAEKWVDKESDKTRYEVDSSERMKFADPDDTDRAQNKFENVYQSNPDGTADSKPDGIVGTDVDDSVVHKELHLAEGGWQYNADDGYYYYGKVIYPQGTEGKATATERLLDSVTLDENVDMGAYTEMKFYSLEEEQPSVASPSEPNSGWFEFEKHDNDGTYFTTSEMKDFLKEEGKEIRHMLSKVEIDPEKPGYANAEYTLTITAQTVQATKSAVVDAFGDEFAGNPYSWELMDEGERK